MMGLTKKFLPVLLWAAFLPASFGFTPLGPFKNWQAPILGYNRPGDIGGPMSPLETYRWNVPVIYYAFDHRFVAYFGRHGVAAVDSAMKTFNDLPRFSQITNDGFYFPY